MDGKQTEITHSYRFHPPHFPHLFSKYIIRGNKWNEICQSEKKKKKLEFASFIKHLFASFKNERPFSYPCQGSLEDGILHASV